MPTTAESRALAFFAGLFALGGVLRFADQFRPRQSRGPSADTALAQQLATVDTARAVAGSGRARSKGRRPAAAAAADTAPPAGVPPELAAVAGWFTRTRPKSVPPVDTRASARSPAEGRRSPTPRAEPPDEAAQGPVDLDTADEAAIEALPGIGPSLARRLVLDRAAHGPFGSLEGLGRVKGVGPVLQARLAPRVTFSGVARPD